MKPCDSDLLTNAIEKYTDLIFRIAYQYLQNRMDTEDVVQETFIRLLRAPTFNDDKQMKIWLIRVTINLCKDIKKSTWYRKTTSLDDNNYYKLSKEQQNVMEDIWRLPAKYRSVIYLYYYEEYTISEIATILNTKQNTVNSWLTRARKKLKNILVTGGTQNDS
jgi:RNA polymerase sigma-70 factor, ECF subfamily